MVHLETGLVLTLKQKVRCTFSAEASGFAQQDVWSLKFCERNPNKNNQVWFYRYDCIVNQAWPNMALDPSRPLLAICKFSGSPSQQIHPMGFNPSENQYLLSNHTCLYVSNMFEEASQKLMLVKTGSANKICW